MDTPTPITTADSQADGRLKVDAGMAKKRKFLMDIIKKRKK